MNILTQTSSVYRTSLLFLSLISFFVTLNAQSRDGKLLQDEKWEKFSPAEKKADFYVSPTGNDSWSGTLPQPNIQKTDGPFATIEQAQKAVKTLKSNMAKRSGLQQRGHLQLSR